MGVFKRNGKWVYRKRVQLPDGRRERIFGTPATNTRAAAERAERAHIERLINPPPPVAKVVPTVAEYAEEWLAKRTNVNAASDRTRMERHVLPTFGAMRMDEVKPRHLRAARYAAQEARQGSDVASPGDLHARRDRAADQ